MGKGEGRTMKTETTQRHRHLRIVKMGCFTAYVICAVMLLLEIDDNNIGGVAVFSIFAGIFFGLGITGDKND